jgi:hypothetical protein
LPWRLGVRVPPPHFAPFWLIAMVHGTWFAVARGVVMRLVSGLAKAHHSWQWQWVPPLQVRFLAYPWRLAMRTHVVNNVRQVGDHPVRLDPAPGHLPLIAAHRFARQGGA